MGRQSRWVLSPNTFDARWEFAAFPPQSCWDMRVGEVVLSPPLDADFGPVHVVPAVPVATSWAPVTSPSSGRFSSVSQPSCETKDVSLVLGEVTVLLHNAHSPKSLA